MNKSKIVALAVLASALGIGVTMIASQQQNVAAFNDQNTGVDNFHQHANTNSDGSNDYNFGSTINSESGHINYNANSHRDDIFKVNQH